MQKGEDIEFEISHGPSFSILTVCLHEGQKMKAETGAMVFMDTSVRLNPTTGGVFGAFKRKLARESFIINEFESDSGGRLGLAPSYPGDMIHIAMRSGDRWVISSGAYMASSLGVKTDSKFQGFKRGFFSGESMFFLDATAESPSDMFLAAYGGLKEFNLDYGQDIILDNGHLVAMDSKCKYDIVKVGGLKASMFSGEGMVLKVTGPGKIITQTRAPSSLISWLGGMMKAKG